MWRISALVIGFFCTAAQPALAQQAGECREFTAPVMVAGEQKHATGRACLQPDGSWRIAQEEPLPPQLYLAPPIYVPPPPVYPPAVSRSWSLGRGYGGAGASYGDCFDCVHPGHFHHPLWNGWGWNGWSGNGWGGWNSWGGRRW